MASAFLSSTGATDLLAGGDEILLPTQDVQAQLDSLPDPAAALQVCAETCIQMQTSSVTGLQGHSRPATLRLHADAVFMLYQAWPGVALPQGGAPSAWWGEQTYQEVFPAEAPLMQQSLQAHQVFAPLHGVAQPGMYPIDMSETLQHYQAMQPAQYYPARAHPVAAATPALAPEAKQDASSSDSQRADRSGARTRKPLPTQLDDSPPDPPQVKGKVKQTHRTAQKRYRERQKVCPRHCRSAAQACCVLSC